MSLHLKLLGIDHPLTFEESKLRQMEAHALIYLSGAIKQLHIKKNDKLSAEKQSLNKLGIKERDSGRFTINFAIILPPLPIRQT